MARLFRWLGIIIMILNIFYIRSWIALGFGITMCVFGILGGLVSVRVYEIMQDMDDMQDEMKEESFESAE